MDSGGGQLDIFNGRGMLIESQGPVWAYGTSAEHHQLYNYNVAGAKNVYLGLIQTETPYFQSSPTALIPFKPRAEWHDPTYSECRNRQCQKAWGLYIVDSSDVYLYGGGSYSFFENYGQTCVDQENCQTNMVGVYGKSSKIWLFVVATKASASVVTYDNGAKKIPQSSTRSTYCSTIALFHQP
jgi:glucan 1,3-beta-glucosidase